MPDIKNKIEYYTLTAKDPKQRGYEEQWSLQFGDLQAEGVHALHSLHSYIHTYMHSIHTCMPCIHALDTYITHIHAHLHRHTYVHTNAYTQALLAFFSIPILKDLLQRHSAVVRAL